MRCKMVTITETKFSDIYITPDKKAFIPNKQTANALMLFEPSDFEKLTEKDIEKHKYSKFRTLFTLNGYLLPANKNIVLPIGADAHEMLYAGQA